MEQSIFCLEIKYRDLLGKMSCNKLWKWYSVILIKWAWYISDCSVVLKKWISWVQNWHQDVSIRVRKSFECQRTFKTNLIQSYRANICFFFFPFETWPRYYVYQGSHSEGYTEYLKVMLDLQWINGAVEGGEEQSAINFYHLSVQRGLILHFCAVVVMHNGLCCEFMAFLCSVQATLLYASWIPAEAVKPKSGRI